MSKDSETLYDTGTDDVPLDGMSEKEIRDGLKRLYKLMATPSLLPKKTGLTEKMARFSTPTDVDLNRFDETLRKTLG